MLSQIRVYVLLILSTRYLLISGVKYEHNWKSLDKRPLPLWFDEAKVGILVEWGVYSVPSVGNEHFWLNWIERRGSEYVNFMEKNYKPNFSYHDFAVEFTAELFNANQWASLFSDSGARYVLMTSKHADGYTLWPSKASFGWNSMHVGPKRDIIKELSAAVRSYNNTKFGVHYTLTEPFNPLYIDDKLHHFSESTYVDRKVGPELKELVLGYSPDIIVTTFSGKAPTKYWKSEEFIAWLYNDSPIRDSVVLADNWGAGTDCKHGCFLNSPRLYNEGILQMDKWMHPFALDRESFGHRFDATLSYYRSSEEVIGMIARTVSCNGNVLIGIGPTKYGTIPPIVEERLRDIGQWLKINGEAIYASEPWIYQKDSITPNVWYTSKDTLEEEEEETFVYAIILDYPYDTNEIKLHPMCDEDLSSNGNTISITLLGMEDTKINWRVDKNVVHIKMPPKHLIDKRKLQFAWTFKISIFCRC